jgi:hypothetical protein
MMPTKRKRLPRGRNGTMTMDSLPFECLLEFAAGWSPPKNEYQAGRSHWRTWAAFMSDWLAVRDEYMQHVQWGKGDVFAENVLKVYGTKGPPANATSDDVRAAFAAAEDEAVAEMLEDVSLND